MFETSYYRDLLECIQFLLAHLPLLAYLDIEAVHLAVSGGHPIYLVKNTGDWWWDAQDQVLAGATIVPVIGAAEKTPWTNCSGDQHGWPLYQTIGNVPKDIRWTPTMGTRILVGLILCHPKGTKNMDKACHNAVGIVLSQLTHLAITHPGLKWDCADGLQEH